MQIVMMVMLIMFIPTSFKVEGIITFTSVLQLRRASIPNNNNGDNNNYRDDNNDDNIFT